MGTKNNPGNYDCYDKANPDEPMFILLARDPLAPILVEQWAALREHMAGNPSKVAEARKCAADMRDYRAQGVKIPNLRKDNSNPQEPSHDD